MTEENLMLTKKGEQMITAHVRRTRKGFSIEAKTHPALEELMRSWGDGTAQDVIKWGRLWEGDKLKAWGLTNNPGIVADGTGGHYCIDALGQELTFLRTEINPVTGRNVDTQVLNMSWLRLCNISTGTGVRVFLKGPFSPALVKTICLGIMAAGRSLYVNYMQPIDVSVGLYVGPDGPVTSSQPWRGGESGLA